MRSVESKKNLVVNRLTALAVAGIVALLLIFAAIATAQEGQNAVYNASSNCCANSPAFIDASVFSSNASDFCGVLNYILLSIVKAPTYPNGAVIDSRGLPATGISMSCSNSLWNGISSEPAVTILLPSTAQGTGLKLSKSR
jgi:hypothetical protein